MLNLIDRLPSYSFFNEARANDPELAKALAEWPVEDRHERLSDWTPEVSMLARIVDRLGDAINAIVLSNGGKKIKIEPVERPVSEIQKIRLTSRRSKYDRLVERMVNKKRREG